MAIDRAALAGFLRLRRDSLQPEDVGLTRGARRRTEGLRREEVAALSHMSADYYARLERGDGPLPSEQMLAAIAQGLHLSIDERDHLFRLAGHPPPTRGGVSDHISPGMLRILDRLQDTPAEIVTELGETLRQTPLGRALTGDTAHLTGMERSLGYRWFRDPSTRDLYDPAEHEFLSRLWVSGLREVIARRGPTSRAARMADSLQEHSAEFREIWERHEVGLRPRETKHFVHPELGALELSCQSLVDPEQSHFLLVYTAVPGSASSEKLRLLSALAPRSLV
ncbi:MULTISPECIES: helix-turn-helix transcriptional regulator [Microbacterium]|uniref:Helix-turn-helix transcriptional regulator n=1 Tax=Microbacterium maritypicum TaxID=33918 RepID=A0ACD4B621_MICMQ|nr:MULTISPECIES: helix-turn-helix transcriptional regulator [Microbacterium]EYT60582.1 XRE family transcriptional regulator [Microbacterium sp. UCD-TDU]UTT52906.1 helix-turn-helix transcriptional regulator [Microbacterium liquefaciens]